MAAIAPSSTHQPSNLMQKSPVDSVPKLNEAVESTNKVSTHRNGSANGHVPFERSATPVLPDPSMFYLPSGYPPAAYYYGGYTGSANEWDDYSRYANHDGVEGAYADMYHPYAYAAFGAYPSNGTQGPTVGHDGQLYGQHYQYPNFFQPPTPTSTPKPCKPTSQGVSTSVATDQPPISVNTDRLNANGVAKSDLNGKTELTTLGSGQANLSAASNGSSSLKGVPGGAPSTASQDSRFGFDGMVSALPQFDVPQRPAAPASASLASTVSHNAGGTSTRSQNSKSQLQLSGMHGAGPTYAVAPPSPYVNRMYPSSPLYGHSGNPFGPAFGFGSSGYYGSRTNRRWGQYPDNKNFRGQGIGYYRYGNENHEGLNELSKGPRNNSLKTLKVLGYYTDVKTENSLPVGKEDKSLAADREKYNGAEFPVEYKDAMFFIIKSYSEDDIHKSIKYNVWASTPNGNKKLDAAFQEAQAKHHGCPVFLFFSVNTSGQFVGVASMAGPVDFDKTVNYWQQDKWTGCFPVKWHIVKDLPNSILKQITLENNENKPVTNSRDTQEVKLEQGLHMLKIFKEHVYRTSVLDDFEFYNNREKIMLEKRAKQQYKKVLDGKISDADSLETDRNVANGKPRMQKPLESISISSNTSKGCFVGQKQASANGVSVGSIEVLKGAKPAGDN